MSDSNHIEFSDDIKIIFLYVVIILSSLSLLIPPIFYSIYEHNFSLGGDPFSIFYIYINSLVTFNKGILSFVEPIWYGLPAFISTLLIIKRVKNNALVIFLFFVFSAVLIVSTLCIIALESKSQSEMKLFYDFIDGGDVLIDGFKIQLKVCVQLSVTYLGVITGIKASL